ncbi:hypothetical protein ACFL3B_05685 [Gemmatimonadota bacterium]
MTGGGGVILHYDGESWSEIPSGTTAGLAEIWGTSASDIHVAVSDGSVLHYDGSSWTQEQTGYTQILGGVWASSAEDVFVSGGWPGANAGACPCTALVLRKP